MALIILAHPNYASSFANQIIMREVQQRHPDLEIRNIHQRYPHYQIDVEAEQAALLRHDTIVCQFPLYWYSMPAILKLWLDEVLTHQFAYGSQGDRLKGKTLLISTTIGQPESAYRPTPESPPFTETLFEGLRHSAEYAQMTYAGALYTYELTNILSYGETARHAQAMAHAQKLADRLTALSPA